MTKQNITILYVEDDDSIRDEMAESLLYMVSNVICAKDGEEGVRKFFENKIDLIITDIEMPKLNGFDMLLKIREKDPNVFAIVVSAYGYSDILDGISRIDRFNDYIQKPFKFQTLFNMISSNLEKRALHNESLKSQSILEQYKKLIDKSAIFMKANSQGVITYVNDEYCHLTNFPKEYILGKKFTPLNDLEIYEQVLKNVKIHKEFKCQLSDIKADGETFFTDTTIFPILDLEGEIIEFAILSFDITEHINSIKASKNAEKAKSLFLAQMSHEIRTPLNGILGFTNILERRNLPAEEKEFIKTINSSASQLLHIINDILDFSKIESGKIAIENITFNPKDEFKNVVKLFSKVAEDKNINLIFNYDNNIPSRLIGDPYRIKQVLSNLLSNAIKFTPSYKKVIVEINQIRQKSKNSIIRFFIKDDGIGIKKEEQKKIFESFSQANKTINRNFGGTGLGLSISSNIIRILGGQITLHSEVNKGSEFSFDLEFEISHEIIENKQEEIIDKKSSYEGKILIVDDNRINRALVCAILDEKGLDYNTAENGIEAINEAILDSYDLILMDINMPKLDGCEAMKQIRKYEINNNKNSTAIVALTANSIYGDKEKYISLGFDEYLSKPIEFDKLELILKKYLKIKEIDNSNLIKPIEVIENVIYSFDEVASKLGINTSILKLLYRQFIDEYPKNIDKLKQFIQNRDFENIKLQAHFIKGACSNLQMIKLSPLFQEIELNAKQQKDIDYLAVLKEADLIVKKYDELEKL